MRSANEHKQQNDRFLKFRSNLNSDTDLSVKRKPTFGSSLFLIKSLYKLYRKWDSLHSLQTVFNRRNLVCNFSWTFLMFSGYFEQRYACFNVISRRLRILWLLWVTSTNHCWWKDSAWIAASFPWFPPRNIIWLNGWRPIDLFLFCDSSDF